MPTYQITGPDGKKYRITGDTPEGAVQALQQHVGTTPSGQETASPSAEQPQFDGGMAGAAALGAADTASFGFGDELGAGLGAASEYLGSFINGEQPRNYTEILGKIRDQDERAKATNPGSYLAGQIGGALTGGAGLAKGGLSATANAVRAGKGLGGITKASAIEGAILGGAQGAGSGEGVEGRARSTLTGGGLGLAAGAVLPAAATAIGGAFNGLTRPARALFNPEKAADKALSTYVKRSGMTGDDLIRALRDARADGQDMFAMVDAMGHAGQRALVPAVRTPNDARQEIVNQILGRQMGQGDRLTEALVDGFAAPQTAKQTVAALKKARDTAADADYGAVRASIGDTPLWGDDLQNLTSRPSVRQAINEASDTAAERGYSVTNPFVKADDGTLALPDGTAPNFTFWDTVKRGIDKQISKDPANGDLIRTKKQLVRMLDDMVPEYSAARDPFRQASKNMEAVDLGSAAGNARVRADDSIPAFDAMTPDQQAAFRAGYVDPYVAKVQAASMSPTTNKARPLMTGKTDREFPAFSAPGMGDQMGNRIAREQRMFETTNAALGNSKTADNLADMDEAANFDPAILANLATGKWGQAAMTGVRQAINAGKGLPPRAVERIGRSLMETNPDAAAETLARVSQQQMGRDRLKALILSSLLGNSSAGVGRLP